MVNIIKEELSLEESLRKKVFLKDLIYLIKKKLIKQLNILMMKCMSMPKNSMKLKNKEKDNGFER